MATGSTYNLPFDFVFRSVLASGIGSVIDNSSFCLINPNCPCDGKFPKPGDSPGPDVQGLSGNFYRLTAQFADLQLPPGAYVIRYYCELVTDCCVGSSGSSTGPDCGDVAAPCLDCDPPVLPATMTVNVSIGDCDFVVSVTNFTAGGWKSVAGALSGHPDSLVTLTCVASTALEVTVTIAPGLSQTVVLTVTNCCPIAASGTVVTSIFNGSCSDPSDPTTQIMTVTVGPGESSPTGTDGLGILCLFADVFYPDPPTIIKEGCDKDVEECCEPEVTMACCPTPLPSTLWATIDAPGCPIIDGLSIELPNCLPAIDSWSNNCQNPLGGIGTMLYYVAAGSYGVYLVISVACRIIEGVRYLELTFGIYQVVGPPHITGTSTCQCLCVVNAAFPGGQDNTYDCSRPIYQVYTFDLTSTHGTGSACVPASCSPGCSDPGIGACAGPITVYITE